MKRAAAVLCFLSFAGCGKGPAKPDRPAPLVAVQKVEQRDVPVEVHAPVDLRPIEQADIGSKTLGYLDAVLVDRGDRVRKGELLAIVRPSDLPDQLAAAKSQAALAQANYERATRLAPSGVVSQQELQQATAAWNAAQAQLNAMATKLGETRIESPIDGWVADRRLDPGALVGSQGGSGTILTVVRTDTLKVFLSVNEHDAAGITVGKSAHVELDALPGKSFTGKVVRVAPVFDPLTRTLDAEVHLENPSGELRPGMYGRGAIVVDVHPAAIVAPIEAVQIVGDAAFAFVVEGGVAHRHDLRLGVDGGDWLEVLDGLKAGDDVVVAGADGLAEGMKVRTEAAHAAPVAAASAPAASPAASPRKAED
jgi:membrane fusion protein (multidrug efflux system)